MDRISRECPQYNQDNFYYKEAESIDTFSILVDNFVEIVNRDLLTLERDMKAIMQRENLPKSDNDVVFDTNPFYCLKLKAKELRDDKLLNPKRSETKRFMRNIVYSSNGKALYDFDLLFAAREEMMRREISVVRRRFERRNYQKCIADLKNATDGRRIETGYSVSDFYTNVERVLLDVPASYDYMIHRLVPNRLDKYQIMHEYWIRLPYDTSFSCIVFRLSPPKSLEIKINPTECPQDEFEKIELNGLFESVAYHLRIDNKYIENNPLYKMLESMFIHKFNERINDKMKLGYEDNNLLF